MNIYICNSSYSYTNEYFDSSTELVYLRSRHYASGTGRFLTRDTWEGDYNRPLSLNRSVYVNGNPINLTDPSGHVPCSMLPPEDQVNCIATPPPPDWWVKQTQLYVDGLGYFDSGHLDRGWRHAAFFVGQIEAKLNLSIEAKTTLLRSYGGMLPLARARSAPSYWVDYAVSERITEDQIYGVAYGMLIDFERGYEEYQSSEIFPFNLSGFAPADLPSDHLGFWAYVNGYKKDEIPGLLQCLGKVHVLGGKPSSVVIDSYGIAENHEFLPMVMETVRLGRSTVYRTRNIAWPTFLEIQPIPSGPNTWQVWNRSH